MADTPALRKARGAFFTPPEISRFIARWAVRSAGDRVLEPSCGEAEFLVAAGARLKDLGATNLLASGQLQGVEVHRQSAVAAAERLRHAGYNSGIETADFFDVPTAPTFDAVVGNPPYVRYQHFNGGARKKALEAALAQGVRLTALSSSWAPFVVHATQFLKPDGRLGLVLPAELLTVNYAASIRDYLLGRFARVRLVAFEERVFPGVLEEVVLLLAEGRGSAPEFEVIHVRDLAALERLDDAPRTRLASDGREKWTGALLAGESLTTYRDLSDSAHFTPLADWGRVYLGGVTGNNDYFTLTAADAARLGIPERERLPISPPGSRHLGAIAFTRADWERLLGEGARGFLFHPSAEAPSHAALRYIRTGEEAGVQDAYKCRVRTPWWRVPTVRVADLFLTYMNHGWPRLVANEAGVHHLNSVHGVSLKPEHRGLAGLLALAGLNTLTLLSAEMVGRSYGGGMLKLEPREATRWQVPSPAMVQACRDPLHELRGRLLSRGEKVRMENALEAVDAILLRGYLKLGDREMEKIRSARETLLARRSARGGSRGAR